MDIKPYIFLKDKCEYLFDLNPGFVHFLASEKKSYDVFSLRFLIKS